MAEHGSRPPGPAADLDDDFLYYLRTGAELVHHGRAEEGRQALERALGLRPDHTKALNLLALAYFKLGHLDRARQIYLALVETYPHEPALFVNLGLVLLREGNLEEAERALRTALMMAPEHTRAHCYLGMVLYRGGDLVRAREHFIRGDAVEFARRLEARIAEGRSSWSTIRAVAADGVESLSSDPPPLRSILGTEAARAEERPVHDDRAWESMTSHKGRTPTAELEASMLAEAAPAPTAFDSERPRRPSHDVPWRDSPMRAAPQADGELRVLALDPMDPPTFRTSDVGTARPREPLRPVELLSSRPAPTRPSLTPIASRRPSLLPAEPSALERPRLPPLPFVEPSLRLLGDLAWAPGFSAGREVGSSARLVVSGRAMVRGSAIVAVAGDARFAPPSRAEGGRSPLGGTGDPLVTVVGEAKLMLRVWRVAVALRDARGLRVSEPALAGFEGEYTWSLARIAGIEVVSLDGRGTVLIDSPSAPLVAPVSGESFVVSSEALLAWTDGLQIEPGPAAGSAPLVQLSGTGHVFVASISTTEGVGG